MAGDRECPTGSPTMARTRLVALTRVTQLADHPLDRGANQGIQLSVSAAVQFEVSAEGVTDFDFGAGAAGVLTENMGPAFTAKLVHPGPMVAGHGEDQLGVLHQVAGKQAGAVTGEIEAVFQPDQIGSLGGGRPIPGTGSGGDGLDVLDAALVKLPQ